MGNAGGNGHAAVGAHGTQRHEQREDDVKGDANRGGEPKQRHQREAAAADKHHCYGAAAINPGAADPHGRKAGHPAEQIQQAEMRAGKTQVEFKVSGEVGHQQKVPKHL